MKTIKKLNLTITIIYAIKTMLSLFGIIILTYAIKTPNLLIKQSMTNIQNINKDGVTAGYEILGNLGISLFSTFASIIMYVLLVMIIIDFLSTLIPTIINLILGNKYKKTNNTKNLKAQTYFNFIYSTIFSIIIVLIALELIEILLLEIPIIIIEILSLIASVKFKKESFDVQ